MSVNERLEILKKKKKMFQKKKKRKDLSVSHEYPLGNV